MTLILYASTSGNTEYVAEYLAMGLNYNSVRAEIKRIEVTTIADLTKPEITSIIFISPTYNVGKFPDTFQSFVDKCLSNKVDIGKKSIICISLGNSLEYDIFCGSSNLLESFTNQINGKLLFPCLKIDGKVKDRPQDFIEMGSYCAKYILHDFSSKSTSPDGSISFDKFKHTKNYINENFEKFTNPSHIFVVGMSDNPKKVGHIIARNIRNSKFTGKLIGINPNCSKDIEMDIQIFSDIDEYLVENQNIDLSLVLVMLAVPAKNSVDIIRKYAKLGIINFINIAMGFKEVHNEIGDDLDCQLNNIILKYNLNVLGPNCLGFYTQNLNATFIGQELSIGDIGFFSQSGAICSDLLDKSRQLGIGFSHFFSIGNKNSIDECDMLEYLFQNKDCKVIAGYIEDFKNPQNFDDILLKYSDEDGILVKPVIIVHPGKSQISKNAINSHTGGLVNDHDFAELEFERRGIIYVEDLSMLENMLRIYTSQNKPKSNNFIILSNAGGPGVIFTDLCDKYSINLDIIHKDTDLHNDLLHKIPQLSGNNPLDIVGDADLERFEKAFETIKKHNKSGTIILLVTAQSMTPIQELTKLAIDYIENKGVNVIPLFLVGDRFHDQFEAMSDRNILWFDDDDDLARTLGLYLKCNKSLKLDNYNVIDKVIAIEKLTKDSNNLLSKVKCLDTISTQSLLQKYNVNFPKTWLIKSQKDIDDVSWQFPVVMKIANEDILHKTDIGGVVRSINEESHLYDTYEKLKKIDNVNNIIVQEQIQFEAELFLGIKKDKVEFGFDPMLLLGTGGIYTNIYNDIGKILLPCDKSEIYDELKKLKIFKIMDGYRNKSKLPIDVLIGEILKFQDMILENTWIKEVDVNPILLTKTSVFFADVKIYT